MNPTDRSSQVLHTKTTPPTLIPQNWWKRWFPATGQCQTMTNAAYHSHMFGATEEGRRVYIGNLLWSIEPPDVAIWLEGAGFTVTAIDMPEARKKGHYCQVEFKCHEDANAAIINLDMQTMRGRHVKMNLSQLDSPPRGKGPFKPGDKPTSTRLWVGGLPHTDNINQLEDYINELFHGFHIESLSNIYAGTELPEGQETNSYCFVDLPNGVEAKIAIRVLNNRETSWGVAHVAFASEGPFGVLQYRGINDENQEFPKEEEGKDGK
ncbi:hypothetical protein TWF730_006050 [Orbilia blumenaviensis]|uniref:RRM domain-containing protein n=1 Tax=Orbilia blumenaviensis TaxID=1796055 RepID=A0AAV9VMZ8_9PEZI